MLRLLRVKRDRSECEPEDEVEDEVVEVVSEEGVSVEGGAESGIMVLLLKQVHLQNEGGAGNPVLVYGGFTGAWHISRDILGEGVAIRTCAQSRAYGYQQEQ